MVHMRLVDAVIRYRLDGLELFNPVDVLGLTDHVRAAGVRHVRVVVGVAGYMQKGGEAQTEATVPYLYLRPVGWMSMSADSYITTQPHNMLP